jgi:hypothetical protein
MDGEMNILKKIKFHPKIPIVPYIIYFDGSMKSNVNMTLPW